MLRSLYIISCFSALHAYDEQCAEDSLRAGRSFMQFHNDRIADRLVEATHVQPLPKSLHRLGIELFGSDEALNGIVENSHAVTFTYANVSMTLRMMQGDDAEGRLPGEGGDGYGLNTFRDVQPHGMINMIDLGGNLGSTVIAVVKLYSHQVHALVVEPVPTTYFFLRWSLWINNITDLSDLEFTTMLPQTPGVRVLNAGVTAAEDESNATEDESLTVCSLVGSSMNSFILPSDIPCNCGVDAVCSDVPTVSMQSLLKHFGTRSITFLKADCEGCEMAGFPALASLPQGHIHRLAGELHMPTKAVLDVACAYEGGRYLTAVCLLSANLTDFDRVDGMEVCSRCNPPLEWNGL